MHIFDCFLRDWVRGQETTQNHKSTDLPGPTSNVMHVCMSCYWGLSRERVISSFHWTHFSRVCWSVYTVLIDHWKWPRLQAKCQRTEFHGKLRDPLWEERVVMDWQWSRTEVQFQVLVPLLLTWLIKSIIFSEPWLPCLQHGDDNLCLWIRLLRSLNSDISESTCK